MSHSGDQNRWVDFRSIKEAVSLEAKPDPGVTGANRMVLRAASRANWAS